MVGSTGLINHSEPLSASEVGLNIAPHRASSSTRPLVPVGATNQDQCPSFVPVCGTNRDQRSLFPTLWAAEKRPSVPVGATNWD